MIRHLILISVFLGLSLGMITTAEAQTAEAFDMAWNRFDVADGGTHTMGNLVASQDIALGIYNANTALELTTFSWDGDSISAPVVIDSGQGFPFRYVAHVTGQIFIAVWERGADNDLYWAKTVDNGATWSSPAEITSAFIAGYDLRPPVIITPQIWTVTGGNLASANTDVWWTTDGGTTWTLTECDGLGISSLWFGSGDDFYGVGYNDVGDILRSQVSDDGCSTLGETKTSGISGPGTPITHPFLSGVIVNDRQTLADPSENGIWIWEDTRESFGADLVFPDAGVNLGSPTYWAGASNIYCIAQNPDGSNDNLIGLYQYQSVTVEGSFANMADSLSSGCAILDGVPLWFVDDDDTLYLWVGEEIAVPLINEPSEFDSGLVTFMEAMGFRTAESRYLFTLILTGVFLVMGASFLKWFPQGRWTIYALGGLSILVGVFALALGLIQIWVFTLSLVVAASMMSGATGLRDTFKDLVRSGREAVAGPKQDEPSEEAPREEEPPPDDEEAEEEGPVEEEAEAAAEDEEEPQQDEGETEAVEAPIAPEGNDNAASG